jgi:hypothetical protein
VDALSAPRTNGAQTRAVWEKDASEWNAAAAAPWIQQIESRHQWQTAFGEQPHDSV